MIKPTTGFLLTEPQKPEEREEQTKGGIIITRPKGDRWDLQVCKAKVLEVGKGVEFQKGQTIYYNYFSGNTVLIPSKDALGENDKELHIVWDKDVLAVDGG